MRQAFGSYGKMCVLSNNLCALTFDPGAPGSPLCPLKPWLERENTVNQPQQLGPQASPSGLLTGCYLLGVP